MMEEAEVVLVVAVVVVAYRLFGYIMRMDLNCIDHMGQAVDDDYDDGMAVFWLDQHCVSCLVVYLDESYMLAVMDLVDESCRAALELIDCNSWHMMDVLVVVMVVVELLVDITCDHCQDILLVDCNMDVVDIHMMEEVVVVVVAVVDEMEVLVVVIMVLIAAGDYCCY